MNQDVLEHAVIALFHFVSFVACKIFKIVNDQYHHQICQHAKKGKYRI
jgi:hypothetical protein